MTPEKSIQHLLQVQRAYTVQEDGQITISAEQLLANSGQMLKAMFHHHVSYGGWMMAHIR
ncbi:cadherin-like domain-containing protein [Vibrio chagasii]|nr:cadherin-like domain-containing protein [Vibrio chagasii]